MSVIADVCKENSSDEGSVVPYNPILPRRFQYLINAELCISKVSGIKYLLKYVFKGIDRVTMELCNNKLRYCKVSLFQDPRYISSTKAVWRVLGIGYLERHLNVVQLVVHLPDLHTVYFQEGHERSAENVSTVGLKFYRIYCS